MKITLGGRYTIAEFADVLAETLFALQDNGVEEVQGASLYLQTYSDRRQFFLLNESGRRIEHLDYDGAHARTFQSRSEHLNVVEEGPVERRFSDRRGAK